MKKIDISTKTHPNTFAIIDKEKYHLVKKHKWYPKKKKDTMYVARYKNKKEIRLHRQLMGFPDGPIDHINRNGLDNRLSNLRLCTHSQNAGNRKLHRDNTSGFRGVGWDSQKKRWRSRLFHNGTSTHIGFFICPVRAAVAYDVEAKKYFGSFYENQVLQAAALCVERKDK